MEEGGDSINFLDVTLIKESKHIITDWYRKPAFSGRFKIKIESARICNLHFEENCFEWKWTKPRLINIPRKQIYRLIKNFIPIFNVKLRAKTNN
ncbi:hypothetical protein ALC57_15601 [Trachymyrmex cornetzi]|uniref:THAP-type domain-containing protein n=1 Tax=Trachymyrmex cornetzi TaxID=471704 RepID=A0A151IWS3_9HYME|nr:hypothetical protein ALC57_15601 [Trachymyrmex cornetzi]